MKLWIRRILLISSACLFGVTCFLWIRAQWVQSYVLIDGTELLLRRHVVSIFRWLEFGRDQVVFRSYEQPLGDVLILWPRFSGAADTLRFVIHVPYWMLVVVGAAYPIIFCVRHRKRKKDAGFPVGEVGPPRVKATASHTPD